MEVGQPVARTNVEAWSGALEVPQALMGGRLQSLNTPVERITATSWPNIGRQSRMCPGV